MKYGTIVADPPWRYRQQRILTTSKRPETRPPESQIEAISILDEAVKR